MFSSPCGDEPSETAERGEVAAKASLCCAVQVCYRNEPAIGHVALRSTFFATEEIANPLAIFRIPALEQTDKWFSGFVRTALIGSRHVVELGTPFANMATRSQARYLERFLALILNRWLALVCRYRRAEYA